MAIKNKIGILGCGWLGLPLAQKCIANGHEVNGSTTSSEKISILQENRIKPFMIVLSEDGVAGNIIGFLENVSILIIDIPPKLRKENSCNFVLKIKSLVPFIAKAGIEKVLFISSTSVYADGNTIVTEDTVASPNTETGLQLLESEKILQENTKFKTTILRFGGLIGPERHPVKFLAGKENLENPDGPINLIHQTDCIEIVLQIIEKNTWHAVFNAVYPFHPTRENYYSAKAFDLQLPLPKFNSLPSKGKTINSAKLIETLNYTFTELP